MGGVNFVWPFIMTRNRLLPLALALLLAVAPNLAWARAGGGFSFGSRGGRTFAAPPMTGTTPYSVAPMQRSLTPSPSYGAPSYGAPSYGAPSYGARPYGQSYGYGARSPFASGLMGGLIGAGIGGMLFGHGMFGGIDGFGSMFGLLIQLALLFFVGRWIFRRVFAGGAPAVVGGAPFARTAMPNAGLGARPANPSRGTPVAIATADYQAFERLLVAVQAAWSNHDVGTLQRLATPEMVSYFAEQMADQASRGVRNSVTDVHLDRGDLSEAWREGNREYATVAMRFSMLDATRDGGGRVVDGSLAERVSVAEVWTFARVPGGNWLLSAIQQAR